MILVNVLVGGAIFHEVIMAINENARYKYLLLSYDLCIDSKDVVSRSIPARSKNMLFVSLSI